MAPESDQDLMSRRQPQPKLAPTPMRGSDGVKETLLGTLLNVRAIVGEMVDDFQASDRFFKYKAGVVASWALLSVLTVIIACPSAKTGPTNDLNARVKIQQVASLDKQFTAIYVENLGEDDWGDTLYKLNTIYTAATPGLRANGGKTVLTLDKFASADGKAPPAEMKPQRLEIRCNRGTAEIDLTLPQQ